MCIPVHTFGAPPKLGTDLPLHVLSWIFRVWQIHRTPPPFHYEQTIELGCGSTRLCTARARFSPGHTCFSPGLTWTHVFLTWTRVLLVGEFLEALVQQLFDAPLVALQVLPQHVRLVRVVQY